MAGDAAHLRPILDLAGAAARRHQRRIDLGEDDLPGTALRRDETGLEWPDERGIVEALPEPMHDRDAGQRLAAGAAIAVELPHGLRAFGARVGQALLGEADTGMLAMMTHAEKVADMARRAAPERR